jgi:hypothetical protein
MIRGVAYSRRHAVACAISVFAVLSAAIIHHHIERERFAGLAQIDFMERDLTRQIASKSDCEQANLDALRTRAGRFRIRMGTEDCWDRLVRQFGKAWKTEVGTRDERGGYAVQVGAFQMRSPAATDWPDIVAAVKVLEDCPGVRIVEFEMTTSGDRERRSVDLVKIVVAMQMLRTAAIPATL